MGGPNPNVVVIREDMKDALCRLDVTGDIAKAKRGDDIGDLVCDGEVIADLVASDGGKGCLKTNDQRECDQFSLSELRDGSYLVVRSERNGIRARLFGDLSAYKESLRGREVGVKFESGYGIGGAGWVDRDPVGLLGGGGRLRLVRRDGPSGESVDVIDLPKLNSLKSLQVIPQQKTLTFPKALEYVGVFTLDTSSMFERGKASLTEEGKKQLNNVAENVYNAAKGKIYVVDILGSADSVGTRKKNLMLSRQRAEAVAEYLRGALDKKSGLKVVIRYIGIGEEKPYVYLRTGDGWKKAPREIALTDGGWSPGHLWDVSGVKGEPEKSGAYYKKGNADGDKLTKVGRYKDADYMLFKVEDSWYLEPLAQNRSVYVSIRPVYRFEGFKKEDGSQKILLGLEESELPSPMEGEGLESPYSEEKPLPGDGVGTAYYIPITGVGVGDIHMGEGKGPNYQKLIDGLAKKAIQGNYRKVLVHLNLPDASEENVKGIMQFISSRFDIKMRDKIGFYLSKEGGKEPSITILGLNDLGKSSPTSCNYLKFWYQELGKKGDGEPVCEGSAGE